MFLFAYIDTIYYYPGFNNGSVTHVRPMFTQGHFMMFPMSNDANYYHGPEQYPPHWVTDGIMLHYRNQDEPGKSFSYCLPGGQMSPIIAINDKMVIVLATIIAAFPDILKKHKPDDYKNSDAISELMKDLLGRIHGIDRQDILSIKGTDEFMMSLNELSIRTHDEVTRYGNIKSEYVSGYDPEKYFIKTLPEHEEIHKLFIREKRDWVQSNDLMTNLKNVYSGN